MNKCDIQYKTLAALKMHIDKVHNKKAIPKYHCKECNKELSDKYRLRDHVKRIHEGGLKLVHCDICDKSFTSKSDLRKHKDSTHDGITYPCNVCQRPFSRKENLGLHMQTIHKIGAIREFKCIPCNLEYSNYSGLRYHRLAKHEGTQHRCTKCERTFESKINLRRHFLKLHEDHYKLFQCTKCKAVFKSSSHFKRHIETVHDRVECKCETCGISVIGKESLQRHVKMIHKIGR